MSNPDTTITKRIHEVDDALVSFMHDCERLGYHNNSNLELMKWDWCINNGGAWYATYVEDKIVSVSGVHPFYDGYRALFRGAQLYPRSVGLNRYQLQSYCWYDQLPLQIKFVKPYHPIYITTNVENDASGKMTSINRLHQLLEKYNLLKFVREIEMFGTRQNIWLLHVEEYLSMRCKF